MAAITIHLSPEAEAALKAQAQVQGLTVEQLVVQITTRHIPSASEAHLQITDPDEWARRFHEWAESHSRSTPLLSDDALSREAIYTDPV